MVTPLEAVLFDFGDTLFHSPSGPEILRQAGLERGAAESVWGTIWERAKSPTELAKGRDLSLEAHRTAWLRLFDDAEIGLPGISELLYERVMGTRDWLPYPDARPTLAALREMGVRVAVVSNIPEPLRPLFERHELAQYVEAFVESHEQGFAKPDLELFHIACRALDVAPEAAIMVGDAAAADGAAVQAGLTVLLLPSVPPGDHRGLDRVFGLLPPSKPPYADPVDRLRGTLE